MKITYNNNVFINCPFDKEYSEIFDAMIFAIVDCGYQPICSLEIDDGTENRLKKILDLIKICRLGIHDLSRTELDKKHKLPRFNMPFELGLFFGAKHYGYEEQNKKNCLVLDSKSYRFQKFISDIAGHDIKTHKNNFKVTMRVTREWLKLQTDERVILPTTEEILIRYNAFQIDRPLLCKELHFSVQSMLFAEYRYLIMRWVEKNPFKH